jgi:transcriptional repressor NrdR
MKCPFCGHLETQVVETRLAEDGDFIRRRRQVTIAAFTVGAE